MLECSQCNRTFRSPQALHAHCIDKADHAYCDNCERLFVNFDALRRHEQNSSLHRDEPSYESESESESESETETESDGAAAFCNSCDRWFINKLSLYQHLSASSRHNWCFICSRDFLTPQALGQHSSSRVHNARDLHCPLCPKTFTVPSAIALHIESGTCHNISRHAVTAAIHSLRVVPTISISRRLQDNPANRNIVSYSATERAFNGTAYECYLCHRTFRTLASLNAHLASPAHDEDEFKCPTCKRTYSLISGLVQHIESEVCGLAKFKQVEAFAGDLMGQFSRLLTF